MKLVDITSTSVQLQWEPPPPLYHNGLIRSYTVLCTELETNRTITETSAVTEMTLRDLHPYYTYNCSVAAVTVREGPFSDSIITKTLEDGMLIV